MTPECASGNVWVAFFLGAVVWAPVGFALMALLASAARADREGEAYMAGLEAGKRIGRGAMWKEMAGDRRKEPAA